jgi:hypothetical protein
LAALTRPSSIVPAVGGAAPTAPSDVLTNDSIGETYDVPSRLRAILWLAATVVLIGPARVSGPGVGLDPGWASGLNLARRAEIRYGRELIFTFGPWGFLDEPLALSRLDFVLGLVFSVASVVAVWLLIWAVLRSTLRPKLAGLVVSLLTLTLSSVSSPSFLLAAVAAISCLLYVRQTPTLSRIWCPVAVAGLGGLLLQVKFSEGLAVSVFAFAACLTSPRARLLRTASSAVTWLVTSLVLWVVAGQSVSDIGPWLRESTDLVKGYSSAMSAESYPDAFSLVAYATALLLIISVLVLGWLRNTDRRALPHLGEVVVTVGALFFGFKETFTRHDPEHNAAFFVIAALLLCSLVEWGPRMRVTALLIALASLLASPATSTYVRANPLDAWALTWQFLTSDGSQSALLNQARANDQAVFGLPVAMVEATRGRSVSVDPWEVSMVWAYSMKWRPMPVFQGFAAYTSSLDQLNANAAKAAHDDQMIIRATTVSTEDRLTLIDGRNPMWESPMYTLTAICNYTFVTADKRWMLLRKNTNRCGDPTPATDALSVSAGEPVQVPSAGAGQIVTASFVPTKPDVFVSMAQLVFKDLEPLTASVDGESFRLPEGLASGPLVAVLPRTLDWPTEFRGYTSARSISFSRPGKVQFHTILMSR